MSLQHRERVFVAGLSAAEEYLQLQGQLENELKKGWFSTARARYALPATGFGQQRYDMDMQATAVVSLRDDDSNDSLYSSFELNRLQDMNSDIAADSDRRRETQCKARDPLNWFGVLVPPALRDAQGSFIKALELCLELANKSQSVRSLADEFGDAQPDTADARSDPGR